MSRTTQKRYSFAAGSSAETRNEHVDKDDRDSKNERDGEGEVECPVGCGECGPVGRASPYTVAIRHGSDDWNRKQCDGDDKDRPRADRKSVG